MKRTHVWRLPARAGSVTLVLAGVIWGAGFILALGTAALAAPQVAVSATSHDFGKVFEDRALGHTFVIKNEGDAPLRVEEGGPQPTPAP